MKIKLLKATVINGSVEPKESVLELPDAAAQKLIAARAAEKVEEREPKFDASPTALPDSEPTVRKSRFDRKSEPKE